MCLKADSLFSEKQPMVNIPRVSYDFSDIVKRENEVHVTNHSGLVLSVIGDEMTLQVHTAVNLNS